jgi:hypothetical protein
MDDEEQNTDGAKSVFALPFIEMEEFYIQYVWYIKIEGL